MLPDGDREGHGFDAGSWCGRHSFCGGGRSVYAGVACAIVWGWLVEKQSPDRWDLIGAAVSLVGMAIIAFAPRQ